MVCEEITEVTAGLYSEFVVDARAIQIFRERAVVMVNHYIVGAKEITKFTYDGKDVPTTSSNLIQFITSNPTAMILPVTNSSQNPRGVTYLSNPRFVDMLSC